MADIKNYIKEKRQISQEDYKEKIRKHKMTGVYRVLIVLVIVAALGMIVAVRYKRHVYTDYDVIASQVRDTAEEATDVRLGASVFTYSNDGAHCTDTKGTVTWNQTYEIQDVKLASGASWTETLSSSNGYYATADKLQHCNDGSKQCDAYHGFYLFIQFYYLLLPFHLCGYSANFA